MTGEIVRDAPETCYARWALSNSGMGELLRCPARLKALFDRAGERDADTPAMLCGRLLHCMVLEPEPLAARWRRSAAMPQEWGTRLTAPLRGNLPRTRRLP